MNIYQLVYVSTATTALGLKDLQAIERVAIKNNIKENLTGVLTYCDCKFMQFLEGSESHLDYIFSKIKKDSRHHSIDVLRYELIPERQFSNWNMKYADINNIHETHGEVCNKIYDVESKSTKVLDKAEETIKLLTAFKVSCIDHDFTKPIYSS